MTGMIEKRSHALRKRACANGALSWCAEPAAFVRQAAFCRLTQKLGGAREGVDNNNQPLSLSLESFHKLPMLVKKQPSDSGWAHWACACAGNTMTGACAGSCNYA